MNLRVTGMYLFMALWLGLTVFAGTEVSAAEKKMVAVNIQEVLLGSASGQEVKNILEDKMAEFQTKFQEEQEAIEAMRAEIEKKSSVWSQQVREEKERDYQKMVREMQLKSEDAQFELQQLEKEVMEPVLNELQKVIEDVGKEKGYAMIIDSRAGLLYLDETLDISESVKQELDKRQKAKK
jgi:outer membrane protein